MYELISNLILYGNLPEDEILVQLAKLLSDDEKSNHELRQEIYSQIKRLLELATQYGFNDNLWHNYLTYLLMTNENPFSMTCEKQGAREGTVNHFALNDFKVFYDLFHYDFRSIEKELNIKAGETTSDLKFTLDGLRCVGACGLAPVVVVDGKVYGLCTPDQVTNILDEYREVELNC